MSIFLVIPGILLALGIGIIYGKSKTWADRIRFTLVLVSIAVSILLMFYIISCWNYYVSGDKLTNIKFKSIHHLPFLTVFIWILTRSKHDEISTTTTPY